MSENKFDYNLLIVFALSIFLLLLNSLGILSPVYSSINNLLVPVDASISSISRNFSDTYSSILNMNSMKKANSDLEQEIILLKSERSKLRSDLEEYKFQLQQSSFVEGSNNYKYLSARILRVNRSSSDVIIFIEKGRDEGVQVGQNVVYENYLVGSIEEVFRHNSIVRVIGSDNLIVPVMTDTTKISGLLEHNAREGLIVTNILPNERVEDGEQIITSGKTSDFVFGLLVGDLKNRLSSESESIQRYKVDGYLNIDDLSFVAIIINQ